MTSRLSGRSGTTGPAARPAAGLVPAAFAVAFVGAGLVGRASVLPGTDLAMVWPAAAVAVLWLAWARTVGRPALLDPVLLGTVAYAVNAATGVRPLLAVAFGVANVAQGLVATEVVDRVPGGAWRLRTPSDLGVVGLACAAGASASAVLGPGTAWLLGTGGTLLADVGTGALRNGTDAAVLVTLALRLREPGPVLTAGRSRAELALVSVLVLLGYGLVFAHPGTLPVGFLLPPLTLWVAVRGTPTGAALHVACTGTFVVVESWLGNGPFAVLDPAPRVLVAQTFVGVLATVALAVPLYVDEREQVLSRLRRESEAALAQSTLLQTVLETVDVGIVACDADGRLTLFNRATREFHGMPVDPALEPRAWADRYSLHDEDGTTPLPHDRVPLVRALRDGSVTDAVMTITPAGRPAVVVACDGVQLRDPAGRLLGAVVAMTDVTAARAASVALQERERRFRAAFHDSPTPIAHLSGDGLVREANDALLRLLGGDDDADVLGRPLVDHVVAEDVPVLAGRLARPDAGAAPVEVRLHTVRGAPRWYQAGATLCDDGDGREPYLLVQLVDVHARTVEALALERATRQDVLTGLGNRAALHVHLEALLDPSDDGTGAALLFLDLDGFKQVNDAYGHEAGDAVLVETAVRLQATVRPGDAVVRHGGDEFVVVCPQPPGEAELAALARRLEQALSEPVVHAGHVLQVGVSVGAVVGRAGEPAQAVLDRADRAMYQQKKAHRESADRPGASGARSGPARPRLTLAVAAALAEQRVRVAYQPVVSLESGRPMGVEALLRVTDRNGSALPPDEVVAAAEAGGLLGAVGAVVLRDAFHEAARWKALLPVGAAFGVGVNVSPLQLEDAAFVDVVAAALAAAGLPASAAVLEVTETRLLPDTPHVQETLAGLRDLGLHLAVDDFGTGFASPRYLARFPFDTIKIDRMWTAGLTGPPATASLSEGVFALARATGLVTVAEGVETTQERDAVRERGCELGQGYFWARPVPAEQLDGFVLGGPGVPAPRPGTDSAARA